MKGIVMTIVMAGLVWVFWMSYEWLRNTKKEEMPEEKLKEKSEEKK